MPIQLNKKQGGVKILDWIDPNSAIKGPPTPLSPRGRPLSSRPSALPGELEFRMMEILSTVAKKVNRMNRSVKLLLNVLTAIRASLAGRARVG